MEWLTDRMEEEANRYFDRIEELGGVIPAIERGFFQREIAEASYQQTKAIDEKRRIVVSLNEYTSSEDIDIPILMVDEEGEQRQVERLEKLRADRDDAKLRNSLLKLKGAAEGDENVMPFILAAAKDGGTLGDIADVFRDVYGEYREPPIY